MTREGEFFTALQAGNISVPGFVEGNILKSRTSNDKYMRIPFDTHPIYKGKVLADGTTLAHAAPTGATGDENLMMFPEGTLEWHVNGTQTILAPAFVATGLNVGMDQTANDGLEICPGILASNKCVYTIGTDAFYAKMKFSLADVSGTDDCAFGFRKTAAYTAAIDDYTDMAVLNVISGTINIETILNNAATTTTSTTDTWADTATHELGIFVSATGAVTYTIDGREPTTTAAFTFDSGDTVIPFFYFIHDTDICDTVILQSFECGLQ